MPAIRQIPRTLLTALRGIPQKRLATAAAALLLTAGAAVLPASRPAPPEDRGEQFGEVHWYQTEKSL